MMVVNKQNDSYQKQAGLNGPAFNVHINIIPGKFLHQ